MFSYVERHVVCPFVIWQPLTILGRWTSSPGKAKGDGWLIDGQQGTGRTEPGPLVLFALFSTLGAAIRKSKAGLSRTCIGRRGRIQGLCNARRPRPRSPCLAKLSQGRAEEDPTRMDGAPCMQLASENACIPPHRAKMLIIIQNLSGCNAAVSCCAHHRHTQIERRIEQRRSWTRVTRFEPLSWIRHPNGDLKCGAESGTSGPDPARPVRSRAGARRRADRLLWEHPARAVDCVCKSRERGLGVEALDWPLGNPRSPDVAFQRRPAARGTRNFQGVC